jgi:predicted SAM-dependent methyltransferase
MVEIIVPKEELKLDLGCGKNTPPGFKGVDMFEPTAHYRFNLLKFPWPIEDSSVDELHCAHFVEHIPMVYVSGQQIPVDENDRDLWCSFFDECWRILKPKGKMTVIVPHVQSIRAFQDPTHRRFHSEANFVYLDKNWRSMNKLEHYLGSADFDVVADRIFPTEETLRHPEAQMLRAQHYWNTVFDLKITLTARK